MYRSFDTSKISPRWLAWASIFWVCAIATRTSAALVVIFLVCFVLVSILRRGEMLWTPRFNSFLIVLGLPMLLGAIGLGWYNAVRFGSVFEFGLKYQLTEFDIHKSGVELFSNQYILPNINNYLLNLPERINPFPYFRAKLGNETDAFGMPVPKLYYSQKITGMVYMFPFLFFAFVPIIRLALKRIRPGQDNSYDEAERSLQWISAALDGSVVIAATFLLVFFYATMRYMEDVGPILVVLANIGFWIGYRAVSSDRFVRFVYASLGGGLTIASIMASNMLAFLSSERINYYSPKFLPALDVLYKSIFSR